MDEIINAILEAAWASEESTTLTLAMKKNTFNSTIEDLLAKGFAISYRELRQDLYSVVIYWGDRYK
jgi:hypothetical protein